MLSHIEFNKWYLSQQEAISLSELRQALRYYGVPCHEHTLHFPYGQPPLKPVQTSFHPEIDLPFQEEPIIESTHQKLIAQCPQPMGLIAAYQLAGIGQRGRQWLAAFGGGLNCSISYTNKSYNASYPYSLMIGLGFIQLITSTIGDCKDLAFQLKWPNDIYLKGKKIAGILVHHETRSKRMIASIGLNVYSHPEGIGTALAAHKPQLSDEIIVALAKSFAMAVKTVCNQANFCQNALLEQWHAYDFLQGKMVMSEQNKITGRAIGINQLGQYIIEPNNTEAVTVTSGSIRILNEITC